MITIKVFSGEVPRLSDRLLDASQAQTAINCNLRSGELRAFKDLVPHNNPTKSGTVDTIYRWATVTAQDKKGSITQITQATEAVVTVQSHGFITGERIYIDDVLGMTEVNGITFIITKLTNDTFKLDGINSVGYSPYISGGNAIKENGFWFHWVTTESVDGVDIARGQIPNDTSERVYFTDGTLPKMTYSPIATSGGTDYPMNWYTLGVPAPSEAPTIASVNGSNPQAITGATQANPVVITAASHGLSTGDRIRITGVGGMIQINDRNFTITFVDTNSFSLDNEDGTGHSAYSSGGIFEEFTGDGSVTVHTWVYTYITEIGEEGPPSSATQTQSVESGLSVTINIPGTGPVGNFNTVNMKKKIYRSITSSSGTAQFYFVGEVAVATTTFTDSVGAFGNILQTVEWDMPPPNMRGIIAMPNGMMAGFADNALCLAVPFQPHAWPTSYRIPVDADIIGFGVYDTNIAILTDSKPYIAQGTDPLSMSVRKVLLEQSCTNRRSIVHMAERGVAYSSPDGLMLIGNTAQNLLSSHMTREEWQLLKPETISGYYWDGRYVGFYDNQSGFIFDPSENTLIFLDFHAQAGFSDPLTDSLFLYIDGRIKKWDDSTTLKKFTWRSKKFHVPRPLTLGAIQVVADTYKDLKISVYADGELAATTSPSDDNGLRLLSGFTARQWEIQITGTDSITEINLAEALSIFAIQ